MAAFLDYLAPFARGGITWLSRRSLPKVHGKVELPGLNGTVEVIRDRWGIPHIYASNRHDLIFAQGYVHAQDRLWQMEINRRTAQGRLSEMFGDLALETDRAVRTFGFNRLGLKDLEECGPEAPELLPAYAEGVNAFLNSRSGNLPIEFTLLRHQPEPWKAQDSAAISRLMIWQLSHGWYGEIVRAQVIQAVGEEHAAELDFEYPQICPVTLPAGIEFNALDPDGRLEKPPGLFLDRGKGSNTWAVSGEKSMSGKPVLCNDMHLAMTLPAIWYENHLSDGEMHVSGVSLPGMPLVLVGHNERIAWGMTLALTDCEDLFVERVDPREPRMVQFKGAWEEAQVIVEPIQVKGRAEPHLEKVLVTRHGPIISDVVGYPEQRLAVNSMALRPCPAIKGWLMLNLAKDWGEFVEALRRIEAPQLNVSYADVEGNIGYWVTGKVPVRAKGRGDLPVPGWDGDHEWIGEVPFEEMPHLFNPQQGYVLNCNNKVISEDYPHFLGNVWMNGYRARRIDSVLKSKEKLSVDDFRSLHMDFISIPGLEFVTHLEGIESDDPEVKQALKLLQGWDGMLTPESIGGAFYEVIRSILVRNLLEPGLGPELSRKVMGEGFHPLLLFASELYGNDTVTLFRMLEDPDSWWIQQAGGREVVIIKSLRQAVDWLEETLGPDTANWQWGKLHQIAFSHALSLQKPLDRVFNRGPYPIGGDTDTVCQTASRPGTYLNNAWSPSVRFIFDLGDLSRSLAVYPPGQSGQLGSPHYDDLIEPWRNGEYHPMLWWREQVEQGAENRLILEK